MKYLQLTKKAELVDDFGGLPFCKELPDLGMGINT